MEEKETLEIYKAKKIVEEEGLYSNDDGSVTMFRCRTNTLKLNWRRRFRGRIVACPVFDLDAEEMLSHFLREHHRLGGIREIHGVKEQVWKKYSNLHD